MRPFRLPGTLLALALLPLALRADDAPKVSRPAGPLGRLDVYPAQIKLSGARAEQRPGVLGEFDGGKRWDLSREAQYASSDSKIAVVDKLGVVHPVANGTTTVTLRVGNKSATVPVEVAGQ